MTYNDLVEYIAVCVVFDSYDSSQSHGNGSESEIEEDLLGDD
jgi:hypothetical protein